MDKHAVTLFAVLAPIVVALSAILLLQPEQTLDREVERLRHHFATVERELLGRDVSHLTSAQRAARARHIAILREYAAAGVFPKNTDFSDRRVPYFVDRAGTRCAMAYLIEQSGSGAYVQRAAALANNASIAEIARHPELATALRSWLEGNGLTLEEAARIQPAYNGERCSPGLWCAEELPTPTTGYKIASGTMMAAALSTAALNGSLIKAGVSSRTSGWLGLGVGAAGLIFGYTAYDNGDRYEPWALFTGATGMLALALGFHALTSTRPAPVSATPWVTPQGSTGLALSVAF